MIIDVFLILLTLGIICIALGLYANNPALSIVGGALVFVCGAAIAFDSLEYKTGLTILPSGSDTIVSYNYDQYTNKGIGTGIALLGFAAIFLTLMENWRKKDS